MGETYLQGAQICSRPMDQLHHGHSMVARMPGYEAALRSIHKPPSKPWRAPGGLAPAPTPPKVYRVEPREFRDLVQRLTGAPAATRQQHAPVVQPVPVRVGGGGEDATRQMYASAAAPWCSFPLMAPAPMHPGLDGHHLI